MRKHRMSGLCAALLLLCSNGMTVSVHAASDKPVYRLYNPNTGEHVYTCSLNERNALAGYGWHYEGIGWKAADHGAPVWRLYNPNAKGGDHYYTADRKEANGLVRLGWKMDNSGKPVFNSGGNVPLYVAYNPNAESGTHHYTTSENEQRSLLSIGWIHGKEAWRVEGEGSAKDSRYLYLSQMPHTFSDDSHAGQWSDTIRFESNGCFYGKGSDSDIPNSIIYEWEYSGIFDLDAQLSRTCWRLKAGRYVEERSSNVWTDDTGLRHQPTAPDFSAFSMTYYLYAPGTSWKRVPDEVREDAIRRGIATEGAIEDGLWILSEENGRLIYYGRTNNDFS